jgi:hypothetical protein
MEKNKIESLVCVGIGCCPLSELSDQKAGLIEKGLRDHYGDAIFPVRRFEGLIAGR